jgi:hypothetical protein
MDAERKIVECLAAFGAIAAFTIFISGCQSTGVVPTGQDSYYIGKKDGSPGLGVSLGNKAAVYREADKYARLLRPPAATRCLMRRHERYAITSPGEPA